MAQNDDVIIVGSLDKKELEKSIQDLVDYVGNKTNDMANKFTEGLDKMKLAMKDFAVTQKVSVDVMKEAWRSMSSSFDAMVAAQSTATSGGGKGKAKAYAPDTIGALEQEIATIKQERKEMELNSDELRRQNALLEERQRLYKKETASTSENLAKAFQKRIGDVVSLPSKSFADANEKLRRLRELLADMQQRPFLFSEAKINRVKNAIDSVETKIERMKKKWGARGSQPMDMQDVLGMSEDSFDAISKKMSALKKISWSDSAEQAKITAEYQRLRQEQNKLLATNAQLTRSNNYLAQSFGYIRNRIVYALTLGAVMSFTKQVYEIRGQYELLERSLGVLVNSFERGSQIFQELNNMAIESPFTLMELAGAAKQLTAYDFAANEVVDTTRRLADISSALGVPMERLTYNLGQIRAQTALTARDARDFANAGLPIVKSLADYFTELEGKVVSTGDVYDRMSKKMVSYSDVMAVLNKMTDEGGKFFEFQAKQAETLRVQMANLNLAWNNTLNEIGESNQGLLTLPLTGLKALLQNWSSLNRIIINLVGSFGALRIVQMIAIRRNMAWAASAGDTAKMMGTLGNAFNSLKKSVISFVKNPWTWVFVGIFAIADLVGQLRGAHQAMEELNNDIREGATEASQSFLDYLSNKGNAATRDLAKQGKLSAEEAEKAWESVEEQLNTSALSARDFMGELLAIDDINERVAKGFDYAERIQQAQAALQDLQSTTIKVTQDFGWGGIFGEGLTSDLKDYYETLESVKNEFNNPEQGYTWVKNLNAEIEQGKVNLKDIDLYLKYLEGHNISEGSGADTRNEFFKELDETAESINNFIVAHGIKDPLQIKEILTRVKAQIKTANPEIKGELATLFDVSLDQRMFTLTNGAIDENATLWSIFMDRLKHNSSSTFQGITDDWVRSNGKLSSEQQAAIDKNLEYFKSTMPLYYGEIQKMVSDASKLRIQIGVAFNVQKLTDFQKEVNNRIAKNGGILDFGSESMLPTQNDDLSSWTKTQQQAIENLRNENKLYAKDESEWSQKRQKENNREIQQRQNLLDLFNQSYVKEKNTRKKQQKDVLGEAFQKEVEIISNIQKRYKEYRKAGVDAQTAITKSTQEYAKTLASTNATLNRYGVKTTKSGSELANMDLRDLRSYYDTLLTMAKNVGNAKGIEALEKAIAGLNVEITKIDYKRITDGLNNELGKLKDEYELALELDASPELGGIFAEMFDINMDALPHTAQEYATRYTKELNKYLKEKGSDIRIPNLLSLTKDDINAFREQKDNGVINEEWFENINKGYEQTRSARDKEIKSTISDYGKLLQKYAEFEHKRKQIQNEANNERKSFVMRFGNDKQKSQALSLVTKIDAEEEPAKKQELVEQLKSLVNEIAGNDDVKLQLKTAIDNKELQESAKLAFEEFQKSPEWIVATGDLAGMTDKALGLLIDKIEKYKKSVKNLSPKEIKQINNALKNLRKQQREGNPFAVIANSIDEAKDRFDTFQNEMDSVMSDIMDVEKEIGNNKPTEEQSKTLKNLRDRWKELWEEQQAGAKVSASVVVEAINSTIQAASQAITMFTNMAKALGGKDLDNRMEDIENALNVLQQGGQGAATGAQIGGGWGALIGGVIGTLSGLITTFADQWSGNKSITERIEESERSVRKLELAYVDLGHEADSAYGSAIIGARQATLANKELQLAEIQRQIQLEKSRKSKNRDEDKIISLEKEYKELLYEIQDGYRGIVDDLMGTNVGSFSENLVSSMISSFKQGEDYMKVFSDKFDEMIDNMIMKSIVSRVVSQYLDRLWDDLDNRINSRSQSEREDYARAQLRADELQQMSDVEYFKKYASEILPEEYKDKASVLKILTNDAVQKILDKNENFQKMLDDYKKAVLDEEKAAKARLDAATTFADSDIDYVLSEINTITPELGEKLKEILGRYYKFGEDSDKQLSALQQGIQGITEDTAGALEGITNGISQQSYLQSDLLTQIRDTILGFDLDIQMGVLSEILLQLQSSYQIQMSIRDTLQGWSNASGMAVRVEMI